MPPKEQVVPQWTDGYNRSVRCTVSTMTKDAHALGVPAPLARVAAHMRDRVSEIADDVLEQLRERLAIRHPDDRTALASIESNLNAICSALEDGTSGVGAPPAALQLARQLVEFDIDEVSLANIYYIGHSIIWERWLFPGLLAECADYEELGVCIQIGHRELFSYLMRVSDDVIDQMRTESFRLTGPKGAIDIVMDVLSGGNPGSELRGYPMQGTHLAFIAWIPPQHPNRPRELQTAAASLADLFSVESRLVVEHGPREVFGWLSVAPGHGVPDPAALSSYSTNLPAQVHVATGTTAAGLSGFRLSHEEAAHAKDYACTGYREPPAFIRYEQVAYESLLVSDRAAARRYAKRQLGPLGDDSETMRELRRTALTFLACGRSFTRAAEVMTLHRNTILHRVRKVEGLLGQPLADIAMEVHAALVISDSLDR